MKKTRYVPTVYRSSINVDGIAKWLTVVNLPDPDKKQDTTRQVHHIQVIDRSGSMVGEISTLIKDVKESLKFMKTGDMYSVYWFSGQGENGPIIVRGVAKEDGNYEVERRVISGFDSVVGATCFSEVLNLVAQDAEAFEVDATQITLFTDGQPVVPWSNAEEDKRVCNSIEDMIESHKINLKAFNAVGYGSYCDFNTLSKWSALTDGGLTVHADHISQYLRSFGANVTTVRDMSSAFLICTIPDDTICIYVSPRNAKQLKSGDSQVMNSQKNQLVILSSERIPDLKVEYDYQHSNLNLNDYEDAKNVPNQFIDGYLYKLAYAVEDEMLSAKIVDTSLADQRAHDERLHAFTPTERFDYKTYLRKLAFQGAIRSPRTISDSTANSSCSVLDILSFIISRSDEIKYIPSSTKYKRIGVAQDSIMNIYESSDYAHICDLVYNKERLNVSLRYAINAIAPIGENDARKLGIDRNVPVTFYRTHTIIKDGNLNVDSITLRMTKSCCASLIKMIQSALPLYKVRDAYDVVSNHRIGSTIRINLKEFPIINIGDPAPASIVRNYVHEYTKYVAMKKVLKYYLEGSEATGNGGTKTTTKVFTESDKELLKRYGITVSNGNFIYNGTDVRSSDKDNQDSYTAPVMAFYIKGLSSIPSVNAALKSKAPSGQIIRNYLESFKDRDKDDLLACLKTANEEINVYNASLMEVRMKYAFSGMTIPGFQVMDDKHPDTLIYDDVVLKYGYTQVKVTFGD